MLIATSLFLSSFLSPVLHPSPYMQSADASRHTLNRYWNNWNSRIAGAANQLDYEKRNKDLHHLLATARRITVDSSQLRGSTTPAQFTTDKALLVIGITYFLGQSEKIAERWKDAKSHYDYAYAALIIHPGYLRSYKSGLKKTRQDAEWVEHQTTFLNITQGQLDCIYRLQLGENAYQGKLNEILKRYRMIERDPAFFARHPSLRYNRGNFFNTQGLRLGDSNQPFESRKWFRWAHRDFLVGFPALASVASMNIGDSHQVEGNTRLARLSWNDALKEAPKKGEKGYNPDLVALIEGRLKKYK